MRRPRAGGTATGDAACRDHRRSAGRRDAAGDRRRRRRHGPSADTGAASGDGASLNEEGFALIREGNYADAVPILQDAVTALEGSGDELTYNYALYNLGVAYLGAGRPADAIPVLEQRMRFDDGQLDEVEAKLSQAYADAGEAPPDDKPGNGPKPGHAVPPPFEETDD